MTMTFLRASMTGSTVRSIGHFAGAITLAMGISACGAADTTPSASTEATATPPSTEQTSAEKMTAAADTQADQDGVYAMCIDTDSAEVCSCASENFMDAVSPEDYGIYATIGADYMQRRANGEPMTDAWDAASAEVAGGMEMSTSDLRTKTNELGRAHRDAIKACGG